MAKKHNIKIDLLVLLYPTVDDNFNTSTHIKYGDGLWLTTKSLPWFWDAYEPDHSKRNNILITPLRFSDKYFANFPPTLIITDEYDVLREEGEEFGNKLTRVGVKVESHRILGTIHDFLMLNPLWKSYPTTSTIDLVSGRIKPNYAFDIKLIIFYVDIIIYLISFCKLKPLLLSAHYE